MVFGATSVRKWSEGTRKAVIQASKSVTTWHHKFIKPEHVLLGVLKVEDKEVQHFLGDTGIEFVKLWALLISSFKVGKRKFPAPGVGVQYSIRYTKKAVMALTYADEEFIREKATELRPIHIMSGLLKLKYPPIMRLIKKAAREKENMKVVSK